MRPARRSALLFGSAAGHGTVDRNFASHSARPGPPATVSPHVAEPQSPHDAAFARPAIPTATFDRRTLPAQKYSPERTADRYRAASTGQRRTLRAQTPPPAPPQPPPHLRPRRSLPRTPASPPRRIPSDRRSSRRAGKKG